MTIAPILWLLAFLPALIALYFLKLRRREVVVSSTLLWRKALEDLHVNAPFQRLRKSWLLLLQLLILAALIFSAWKPRVAGEAASGRHVLLLLDVSGSMAAREPGGRTRLEAAKAEAIDLVRGMEEADRMALLAFSSRTASIEPLTADKALLESAIRGLAPTALPTDLAQALLVAHSLAESFPDAEIYVVGDGSYGGMETLPPEVKLRKLKFLGKASPLENTAITEIDVRSTFGRERRTEVFALVENFGSAPVRLTASFEVEGRLKDARQVELPPGGSQPVVFDASGVEPGIVSVSIDSRDALEADDRAWARIDPPRKISTILVGEGNPWLELALKASARIEHRRMTLADLRGLIETSSPGDVERRLAADVLIFDREAPAAASPVPAIYIACLPPLPGPLASLEVRKLPSVIDWDRSHPVNRFLVFTDLYIEESRVFPPASGYTSLVDSEAGSILGIVHFRSPGRPPMPTVLVGFDVLKSNWPLGHYSFPIFISNAVEWLGAGPGGERPARHHTGDALVHFPPAGSPAPLKGVYRMPSGRELPAVREENGSFVTTATGEAGVYELVLDGETAARFPVALLDRKESRLVPAERIDLGDFTVEVKSASEEAPRDLWKWFALGALGLVLLEWRVYMRRLG